MSYETVKKIYDIPAVDEKNESTEVDSSSKQCSSSTKQINNIKTLKIDRMHNYNRIIKKITSYDWDKFAISFLAIVGAIVVWQMLSYYKFNYVISFENIPTPIVVGKQFLSLIVTEEFYKHIGASLQRIGIAFFSASLLGVIIGIFMGRSRIFNGIMMPYIEILRPIPAVAWIPLAILMLPTEESSIIYITFLGAFSLLS